jgi:hypothetical protein
MPFLKSSNLSSSRRTFWSTTSYPAVGNRSGFNGFRTRFLAAWNIDAIMVYQGKRDRKREGESATYDSELALVIVMQISKDNQNVGSLLHRGYGRGRFEAVGVSETGVTAVKTLVVSPTAVPVKAAGVEIRPFREAMT